MKNIKKSSLRVGRKYEIHNGLINTSECKIVRMTKNLVYITMENIRHVSSGSMHEKTTRFDDVIELKMSIDAFLYIAEPYRTENSPLRKTTQVCSACGSEDLETHYDHDCWGKPDGSRTICNDCGCNRTKFI